MAAWSRPSTKCRSIGLCLTWFTRFGMRSAGRIMPPPPDIPAVPHKALGDAMRRGLVSLNVVERTAALSRTPIARLTLIRAQEVHAFIKAAHRWQPLLTVTALTVDGHEIPPPER